MASRVDGSINIDTKIDSKGFDQGTKKINQGAKSLTNTLKKLGVAVAAYFSTKALVNFGKAAISLASDLEETQNVVDVAFEGMTEKVEAFAAAATEAYGLSELSYKKMASMFMAMGKGIGLTHDTAEGMALSMTNLAADMSSFYNIRADVAETALKSVYTGETESLKKYGIAMTQVNLEQFAMSKGLTKAMDDMTQAEKVQLRYLYVTEQLSLAAGDFTRNQDSWANQTRILQERWNEFMTNIGQSLIKYLNPALQKLNEMVKQLVALSAYFTQMNNVSKSVEDNAAANEKAVESEQELGKAIKDTTQAAKKALLPFDDLTILKNEMSGDTIDFGLDFEDLIAPEIGSEVTVSPKLLAAVEMIKSVFGVMQEFIQPRIELIKFAVGEVVEAFGGMEGIKEVGSVVMETIGQIMNSIIPLLEFLIENVSEKLAFIIGTWKEIFTDTDLTEGFVSAINIIVDIIQSLVEFLDENIFSHIEDNRDKFIGMFEGIGEAVSSLFELIKNVVSAVMVVLGPVIDTLMESFIPALFDSIKNVVGVLQAVLDIFNALFNLDFQGVVDGFSGLWDSIEAQFENLKQYYQNLGASIWGWMEEKVPLLTSSIENMIEAIKIVFDIFKSIIKLDFSSLIDSFGNIVAVVKKQFTEMFDGVKNAWKNAWDWIGDKMSVGGDWFKGIGDSILDAFKSLVNKLIDGINNVISIPFDGINTALKGIKGVNILGLKPFDWMPTISIPKIPKLAKGAVIPPNNEFLAVLGDQKSGRNFEAPESLLREVVNDGQVQTANYLGEKLDLILEALASGAVIELDGRKLSRGLQKYNDENDLVKGRSKVVVGNV